MQLPIIVASLLLYRMICSLLLGVFSVSFYMQTRMQSFVWFCCDKIIEYFALAVAEDYWDYLLGGAVVAEAAQTLTDLFVDKDICVQTLSKQLRKDMLQKRIHITLERFTHLSESYHGVFGQGRPKRFHEFEQFRHYGWQAAGQTAHGFGVVFDYSSDGVQRLELGRPVVLFADIY